MGLGHRWSARPELRRAGRGVKLKHPASLHLSLHLTMKTQRVMAAASLPSANLMQSVFLANSQPKRPRKRIAEEDGASLTMITQNPPQYLCSDFKYGDI